jgi:xanthine dehydrogenase accessory factor
MKDFYQLLTIMNQHREKSFAMATIINVKGSAYRHAGAKMLYMEGEKQFGTISAGCLEEDLRYVATEVMLTGKSKRVTYNLMSEDDLTWGQGAGCNGEIEVYVEPFKWGEKWQSVKSILDNGQNIVCIKALEGSSNKTYLYTELGSRIDEDLDNEDTGILSSYIDDFLQSGNQLSIIKNDRQNCDFIFEKLEAKDSLYIFGAGPDVEPLVEFADRMNFAVTVIDPRSSKCCTKRFPKAAKLVVQHPETYLKSNLIPKKSFVLIMTHNFNWDRVILDELLEVQPTFLGVLGPRSRSERLLSYRELPVWVQSPIGLEIGAEGPEEISLSIVAQMVQIRNRSRLEQKRKSSVARVAACSIF